MDISVFEVAGPVMIGPSSSHTAGAARLARIAARIAAEPFHHVSFGLHGSFARTYKGHGTDRALLAGALGMREDDERLADSFDIAAERGVGYDFHEMDLDGFHENSVEMVFALDSGKPFSVTGSSLGGGRIAVKRINGFNLDFTAHVPTLVIEQRDEKGVISEITGVLANHGINIGTMRVSRTAKGETACCVIELDAEVSEDIVARIKGLNHVITAIAVHPEA
ncbi:MAG: L-serine ammonia-lyase, iron-sulfur-dependent subunit beta [Clostridiales bacterium]|jgi:L-serine dehydratase|nr:L-serine ammonia-lyase, iron-sulfur-dependent subunit beta [Clostridiales bacterium]